MTQPGNITLVRRDDLVADVDSMSLVNYTNGFALASDGWAVARPVPSDQSLVEALKVQTKGSSPDNLAANLQTLDGYLQKVTWYQNPQEKYGIWLRVQQPRETGARQALLLSAKRDPLPVWSFTAQDGAGTVAANNYGNLVQAYGLALERTPFWESTSSITFDSMTSVSTVGGMATLGGSGGTVVVGDVPARLALVEFDGVSAGGGPLAQIWLGFRSARFGTPANFVPVWNLALAYNKQLAGGAGGGTATATVDASAKSGTAVVCGFADGALARRVTMYVTDASPTHYTDQRGTFLVLLRAKLSGAGQVNVRLVDGLQASPTFATRDRVAVTGTAYALYEMGTVRLPTPGRSINSASQIQGYALGLDAEQVTGTPTLSVDCLILIPVDEGWMAVSIDGSGGQGVLYFGGDQRPLYATNRAEGSSDSSWYAGGIPQVVGVPRVSGGLPVTNGTSNILVLAAQRQTSATVFNSTVSDLLGVQVTVYERWESLRGAAA